VGTNAGDGNQRDAGLIYGIFGLWVIIFVMNLKIEEFGADFVVSSNVFLIAVETLPIAAMLVHLCRREAANSAAGDRDGVGRGRSRALGGTGR
jgi:hypothetical protein